MLHRNDKQVNARTCKVLGLGQQEHLTPWHGLLVGDVVKIEQDRVSFCNAQLGLPEAGSCPIQTDPARPIPLID